MSSRGILLFLGSDRPAKLQRIQALERSLGIQPLDRHHLDAAQLTGAQLLALCRQQPAESPVRLIVVDQAHRLDQPTVAALLQRAEVIAKSACLVLLVETELSVRHALSQAASSMVTERFTGRNAITAKPFALTDALGTRDAGAASSALHEQRLAGKEPLELLGLVAWQLNRWVLVKRLGGLGYGTERIATVTGFKPWQVERAQAEVARRSLDALQRMLERCWQLDVDAKRGRAIPELAVEQLVTEVCLSPQRGVAAAHE